MDDRYGTPNRSAGTGNLAEIADANCAATSSLFIVKTSGGSVNHRPLERCRPYGSQSHSLGHRRFVSNDSAFPVPASSLQSKVKFFQSFPIRTCPEPVSR